ncbi:alkane 1-monooxygenase [Fluoribacter dumoffii]|uniref:Alkane 1-monooxygenase 2 n=1 Tax=Fluoribacter dumoffii TaxID=463 RepID=A0A377GAH6_9GAMM|nr:alkane 1-monooxygenase [Fluoribacter dumoffii]KTC88729.1 alkane monooxygenase [Fluoribacter dumoffii NY 23]MCW8385978.1 alkane 1-monooxygenase [Fluoribacter dumoffii]MCW8419030.1 alkane 1-monooxygenase [Fluoribacter dumoffii]MCW8453126.1 alkane 1-monooxygenase [Fluoribacter dumoffii]MCW8459656.1 alkane 1-monooxygenase [Fluoribacter dumoffii]
MKPIKKLCFMLVYVVVTLPFIGFYFGGFYTFLPFLVLFTLIPLLDVWLVDASNPDSSQEPNLLKDKYFKLLTWIYVPVQYTFIMLAIYLVVHTPLTAIEFIGFGMSIGLLTGGIGITLAHELMHKNSSVDQLLSKVLLTSVCYGHFFIEHVRGHHVHVATPKDPATSRLGESVYHFLPRTLIGSFRSALSIERKRLNRNGYPWYHLQNQFWWIITLPVVLAVALYYYGGWPAFLFFILQSVIAVILLEIINYIEHYGMERKKLANGFYEKVSDQHSWNANHWLSNMLLFQLQRHSDHHMYGARPYQLLRHIDSSPQLPSGYLGMIILALFPFLWRRVMDKRVLAKRGENL